MAHHIKRKKMFEKNKRYKISGIRTSKNELQFEMRLESRNLASPRKVYIPNLCYIVKSNLEQSDVVSVRRNSKSTTLHCSGIVVIK